MSKPIGIAMLVGTIVGAGILGIPYVVARAGLIPGIITLLGIGLLLMLLNLFVGEITLRTKGNHQLTGYAEIYLGKKGKIIFLIAMIVAIYGALLAYTLGEGTTFAALFGGNQVIYSLLFFGVASFLLYKGLRTVGKTELIMVMGLIIAVVIVSFWIFPSVNTANFMAEGESPFGAYGVVLFAYLGVTSVPLIKEILSKERKKIKGVIMWGSFIPIIIYTFFALAVMGVIGLAGFNSLLPDERIASAALDVFVGGPIGILISLFAILAMGTSFLALGTALQEMFHYDYRMKRVKAWLLTISVPLLIFLIDAFVVDITNFVMVLGIVGAISGGVTNNLIILIFHKAKKLGKRKPEYSIPASVIISGILFMLFAAGIIYGIMQLI